MKYISQPGVELSLTFRRIRDDVLASTKGRQEPFTYGSLGGREFYFVPGKAAASALPTTAKGWAERVNEINGETPLERMIYLFGAPVKDWETPKSLGLNGDIRIKVFRAGPWDLHWFGNATTSRGMGVVPNLALFEGPMSKDAQSIRFPLVTLDGANGYKDGSSMTFSEAQMACSDGKATGMIVRASTRAVLTPNCYFGRPGRYLYYAFAFERSDIVPPTPACQKELDEIDTLEFTKLKCKALWETQANLMFVDWSGAQIASNGLFQIWTADFDR